MEKTTKREMFEAVISLVENGEMKFEREGEDIEVSADAMVEFANHEIDLLDKKAVKAKEHAAKKKNEMDELADAVQQVLTDELQITEDIAAQIEGEDVSRAKIQARLNKLVKAGAAIKEQVSVPGTDGGKARKLMAYRLRTEDDVIEADAE